MEDSQKHTIDVLEKLIETCRDGQNGYREAAEHIKAPDLKAFFAEQSVERAQFAANLENEVQRLGKRDPDRTGSATAALHRRWIDLKSKVGLGDDDANVLEAVEQGEDSAKKSYEEALSEPLPENIMGIVRTQAQSVIAAHDRVKLLRDRRKAA